MVFFLLLCFLQGVVNNHVNDPTRTHELDLIKTCFSLSFMRWTTQTFHSTFCIFQSVFTRRRHGSVLQIVRFFCFFFFF